MGEEDKARVAVAAGSRRDHRVVGALGLLLRRARPCRRAPVPAQMPGSVPRRV